MKKIGLALGGGGAKGFAHIGVLKVFDEIKVRPDVVSGCSMGAIIGALYCLGYTGKQIEKKANEITIKKILKMLMNRKAKNNRIEEALNELFENRNFEDLRTPLYVNAVDIDTGEEIIFDKGNIAKAVRASISLPFMFRPAIINGRALVDGGVRNNVPIEILKDKRMNKIIAVDVNSFPVKRSIIESVDQNKIGRKPPALMNSLTRSLSIIQSNKHIINFYGKKSNLVIKPEVEKYTLMDFTKKKIIIKIGEEEARKNKRKIKEIFRYRINKKSMKEFFENFRIEN